MVRKTAAPKMTADAAVANVSDGLMNLASGMGTELDKSTTTYFTVREITKLELDNAFRGDWIARKGVLIPAYDATREWRSWQAEKNDITKIETVERMLGVQLKTQGALVRARLYGGGAIVMGVGGDAGKNQTEPLELDKIKAGDLKFIHVVSKYDINAGPRITDLSSPWYGEPEYYERQSDGNQTGVRLHPSRVVRLVGQERLDMVGADSVWGDSVLQSVADAIKSTGTVTSTVAQLVHEAKIDIINVPGMTENMGNKVYEEKLKRRFGLANIMKSVYHILLLDGGETWNRQTTNVSGMPDIVRIYLLIASGALDIPATRFLSQSPAGLSATGDSDIRNYYDSVKSEQSIRVTPAMSRLDEVIIRSALGTRPPELFYNWNSLWQMDEVARAELENKRAAVFKTDVDSGLFADEVLREARTNQLIESGFYPGFEQIVEEHEVNVESGLAEDPSTTKANAEALTRLQAANQNDATPRPLYVRRDVLNAEEIHAHYKAQGVDPMTPTDQMHVTIIYTLNPVDWMKAEAEPWQEDEKGNLTVKPGGPRMHDIFGPGPESRALVLMFSSSVLTYRHMRMREELGASVSHDEYQPHVTLSYNPDKEIDVEGLVPWNGPIEFGPEIFENANPDWRAKVQPPVAPDGAE